MFRKTLAALIVVVGCTFATSAFAGDYAAIAYSPTTGQYGYSYGAPCLDQAESTALTYTSADDAQIMVWSENEWCRLAVGDNESFGYGYANTRYEAEAIAMRQCSALAPGAHIVAATFSGINA